MGASATVTVRVDESLKRGAADVAAHYGLDLSTVTRMLYTQMVNTYAVPLKLNYEQPNEESLQAIRETEEMIRSGKGGYNSLEEMWEAMGVQP